MTYIISDIHGEYGLLVKLMNKIGFSDRDLLYVGGDMIEKGDGSVRVLELLRDRPNVRCILGNHEQAFLDYYHHLMRTSEDYEWVLSELKKYLGADGELLTWDTVDWLEALPYYIETDDFILVHAGVGLDGEQRVLPLKETPNEIFLYDRGFKRPDRIPKDTRCVFFGHTQTSAVSPSGKDEILIYTKAGQMLYAIPSGAEKAGATRNTVSIEGLAKVHLDLGTYISGRLGTFCIDNCTAYYISR